MSKRQCEDESLSRDTKKHITEKKIAYTSPDKYKSLCDKSIHTFTGFDDDGSRSSTKSVQVIPPKICKQCHTMALTGLMCEICSCYMCDRCGVMFCMFCHAGFCRECFEAQADKYICMVCKTSCINYKK